MLNSFGETSYAQIDMELLKKIEMIEVSLQVWSV